MSEGICQKLIHNLIIKINNNHTLENGIIYLKTWIYVKKG